MAPRYEKIPKERELVKNLGIQDYVEFITKDIKIEDYVAMADVLVLPYNSLVATEGNPSCMLEAMACKTPVVTANLPELNEIAQDCVIMTNTKDKFALAQSIKRVILENNQDMIEKAYLKAQEFDGSKIAKKVSGFYSE